MFHTLLAAALLPSALTSPAPQDLRQLLPQGTLAYVELASLEAFDRAFRDVVGAIEPGVLDNFDAMDVLTKGMRLQGDLSGVLHDKPLGVGVAFPGDAPQPVPIFLVPFADPAAYVAALPAQPGLAAPRVSGSYVALTMGPDLGEPGAGAALVAGMRPGLVSARLDLDRLIELYRPLIDSGLAMAHDQMDAAVDASGQTSAFDAGAVLELYFQAAEAILDSAETLELTLDNAGTAVSFSQVLAVKADSPLGGIGGAGATPLAAVAGSLSPDAPITFIGTGNMEQLMRQMMPALNDLMAMYPQEFADAYTGMLEQYAPLYGLMGDAFAGSGAFAPDGMRFTYVYAGGQPQAAIDGLGEALADPSLAEVGIAAQGERARREVGGGPVYVHEFVYDWEKVMALSDVGPEAESVTKAMTDLMGESFRLSLAPRADRLVMVVGGDDAYLEGCLADAARKGPAPASLATAVRALGAANPALAMQMDLASLMSQVLPQVAEAVGEDKDFSGLQGLRVPLSYWLGIEGGRIWRTGVGFDAQQLAAMIAALD